MSTGEEEIPDVGKIAIVPVSSLKSRKKTPFNRTLKGTSAPKSRTLKTTSSAMKQLGIIYDDESYKPKQLKKDTIPYLKADDLKLLENPDEFKKLIKKQNKITL